VKLIQRIREHPWGTVAIIAASVVAFLVICLASLVPFHSDAAHRRIVAALSEHLQSEVELGDLHWRVLPQLRAEGEGLVIRHKGRTDVPPLISVKRFSIEGNVLGLLRRHVSSVTLEGLDIQIPPRRKTDGAPDAAGGTTRAPRDDNPARAWTIDSLVTTAGRLAIVPSRPDREPKEWTIHNLEMRTVGFARTMPFAATITNAIPEGEVVMNGTFGPWAAGSPGETAITGDYTFADADLSVFKGIAGVLSAHGSMTGTIDRIETRGETDTPDFTIRPAGHPVPVHAKYHAIVDGTNGDTYLERVELKLLETDITTKGAIVKIPGQHGRRLTLDVQMAEGRLEDVLRLVVKTPKPTMTGGLSLNAKLDLPPGSAEVLERMKLDGDFHVDGTRFTDPGVQQKLDELSLRGRGKLGEEDARRVGSNFAGRFQMNGGVLAIPAVAFDVPGAMVRMAGNYHLEQETIDFAGTLLMDARVSETTKGMKATLLKLVDPLFRRPGGGSAVPIAITGTRENPKFGLDKSRVLNKR
jgi:hypothetical protein